MEIKRGELKMIGDKLKIARKKAKLSQEKVAEIINTSRSNISKYETGFLEPNIETLKKLCELYKISADELLEINNNKIENNINIKQRDYGTVNINNK